MYLTVELSLYPLKEHYESDIIRFISALKENKVLEVHTHSMSTFIKGEKDDVFAGISAAMDAIGHTDSFSLVMKVINRNLPVETGFLEFE